VPSLAIDNGAADSVPATIHPVLLEPAVLDTHRDYLGASPNSLASNGLGVRRTMAELLAIA
jgi:hypothetical protein